MRQLLLNMLMNTAQRGEKIVRWGFRQALCWRFASAPGYVRDATTRRGNVIATCCGMGCKRAARSVARRLSGGAWGRPDA